METKNQGMSTTGIIRLVYTGMFGYLILALIMLMLFGCGQQVPQQTTTDTKESSEVTSASAATTAKSIKTASGDYARLVESVSDLACDDQNVDQLIYVKSESQFYYCDDSSLKWTVIDVEAPAGKAGIDGVVGKDGIAGISGKDGVNGKDGTDGKDGVDGINGTDGTNGVDGAAGIEITGTYSHIDYNGSYILNSNSNQNLQTMTLAVFSDGSYSFTASVFISGIVYNPTFWVSADKAQTAQTRNFKVVGSLNRLEFSFPSGNDMLSTAKTAVDSGGNSGQAISVGARLYTNGNTAPNFLNFTVNYEY